MKRIFLRVGISLVGLISWILPNQAKADGWHNCHSEVDGKEYKWSCASQNDCRMDVYITERGTRISTYCA